MVIHEYEMTVSTYCGDCGYLEKEYRVIVEYTRSKFYRGEFQDGLQITPDEEPEIEIQNIRPKGEDPSVMELMLARWLNEQDNHDQLIDRIWQQLEQ